MIQRLSMIVVLLTLSGTSNMCAQGGNGKQPAGSQSGEQRVLDILAAPVPADSNLPKLPPKYADWTEDQRRTAQRQITGRCVVLWTMMNSGGPIPMLPDGQDPGDTPRLVQDLCVAGKMPRDWPGWKTDVAEAKRILERARQLGANLSLPASLNP